MKGKVKGGMKENGGGKGGRKENKDGGDGDTRVSRFKGKGDRPQR